MANLKLYNKHNIKTLNAITIDHKYEYNEINYNIV